MHENPEWDIKSEITLTATLDNNIRIKGRIDALVVNQALNEVIIYDWKTGKLDTKAHTDPNSDVSTQAAIYILLARRQPEFTGKNVKVVFDYISQSKPENPYHFEEETIANLERRIAAIHARLSSNTSNGCGLSTCSWCSWQL